METIPIFLKIKGKGVLVVGGTPTALQRLSLLQKAGAKIVLLLAPAKKLAFDAADYPEVNIRFEDFSERHLDGQALVFAAADDQDLNRKVSLAAQQRNIPVNAFDIPEYCTFNMPAIVDRDPVVVAISSDGNSPTLASIIRQEIDQILPENLGEITRIFGTFRPIVQRIFGTFKNRQRFWRRFLTARGFARMARQTSSETRIALLKALNSDKFTPEEGKVYLVGAGPGDPELMTRKAWHILMQADIVFYDRLVNSRILEAVKSDSQVFYVGKTPKTKGITQREINTKIVEAARRGKQVVRLKSGDPFIFGRAGEELKACRKAGVKVEIVPGITAALAAATVAQIPLTQREISLAFTLVTGKLKDGKDYNFFGLVGEGRTFAIYMGVSSAGKIQRRLLEQNLPASTPISIVASATLPEERIVFGFLSDLENLVKGHRIRAPAIIFIGNIVAEAPKFPLHGNAPRVPPLTWAAPAE